jgi:hypothetical protein
MDDQTTEALVKSLALEGHTVFTFDVEAEHLDQPDSGALYVMLVEGERIILVGHGWGSSGAHVDVRCYVGRDTPRLVEPVVVDAGGTVMVLNPSDGRPSAT